MRDRLAVLKRVLGIYGALEEVRSAELSHARAALHEVQQAIGAQTDASDAAKREGREAFTVGDRVGWTATEALHGAAMVKRDRLEPARRQRELLSDAAKEEYLASRLKREQMQRLVERAAEQLEQEEERRMQAISDDRFLARRWMRENARMKIS